MAPAAARGNVAAKKGAPKTGTAMACLFAMPVLDPTWMRLKIVGCLITIYK